jgi:flagellar biosynthesis protein FliQ
MRKLNEMTLANVERLILIRSITFSLGLVWSLLQDFVMKMTLHIREQIKWERIIS